MKQVWAALMVSALAQMAFVSAFAQTPPDAPPASSSAALLNPQQNDKPAILLPNGTKDTQYDLNFGFPDRNGPLSAMLVVIPKAELEEFNKPGGVRHLDRVARAEPGAVLAIKIMVTGPQNDANGVAKVTSDVHILTPSGETYGKSDYKDLPVWVGPAGKGVYDNRDRVVLIRFEPNDAPGLYTIKAMVHDRFAQRDIPLETKIELLPPRGSTAPAATAPATVAPTTAAQPATADDDAQPADVKPAAAKPAKAKKRRKHR
ncbi:MAG TPA: hypothetical protein VG839_04145 [Asticcacaulis sp.]|nr:hypothetical protein [Asticcacaulis sp.]